MTDKPKRPKTRMILESDDRSRLCYYCDSSLKRKILSSPHGCLNPECINFYKDCLPKKLEKQIEECIRMGDASPKYKNLIQTIVKLHHRIFTEENIPTAKSYIIEKIDEAFERI